MGVKSQETAESFMRAPQKVSISPTFFEQLFSWKSQMSSFSVLKFWLYSFGAQGNGRKSCFHNLVKLTTGVLQKNEKKI